MIVIRQKEFNSKAQKARRRNWDIQQGKDVVETWNNNSIDCKYMFNGCKDILEINFPNFDTQNCKTMSY